jgi:hypothetical protein
MARKTGYAIKDAIVLSGVTGPNDAMATDLAAYGRVLKGTTVIDTSEGTETDIRDEFDVIVYSDMEAGKTTLTYSVLIGSLEILKKIYGGDIDTTETDIRQLKGLKQGFSKVLNEYQSVDVSWRAGVGLKVPKTKTSATFVTTTAEGILVKMKHVFVAPDDMEADMVIPYEPKDA